MNLSYLQIETNLSLASVNDDDIVVVWSRSLGSLAGIKMSDFQIGTSSDFEWDALQGYDLDEVVTFEGGWYQSLVAGIGTNTGNLPTNGLFWLQINKISGVIIPEWTPGLVTDHLTLFREGAVIYGLKNTATLPFDSQTTPSDDPTNWENIGNSLQLAYNVSSQILTNAINGALSVQRGSALDTDNIYEGKNGAGTITFYIDGNGDIVANKLTIAADTDAITILGRTIIDSRITDRMVISHIDNTGNGEQAIVQLADGSTFLNSKTGQNLSFTTGGSLKWSIDGTTFALTAIAGLDLNLSDTSAIQFDGADSITGDGDGNITVIGKLNASDRLALGLIVGDVAAPLDGEEWYNDSLGKFRAKEDGEVKNSIPAGGETIYPLQFEISSDAPTSSFSLFTGHIEVDDGSEQLNGKLTDATYQTSLDDGDTLIDHATLTILQTWIDANITLPGTDFLLRTIGIYGVSEIGEAQVKFNYQIA